MALDRNKKVQVVSEVGELLDSSKLTVVAKYAGTSVKSLQQLRAQSADSGTQVRVVKNRLFKRALQGNNKFKDVDLGLLNGQLLYAFNSGDEVAPAQNLAVFAKEQPQIEFVGGFNGDGQILSAEELNALAILPSKDQLRAQLIGTLSAPLSGFANVLSGNVRSILNVLSARSEQIS